VVQVNDLSRSRSATRVRAQSAAIGAETRLLFLDVPRSELDRRIARRTWPKVTNKSLDRWSSEFEVPDPDEYPRVESSFYPRR
jgi:hypothetical protein